MLPGLIVKAISDLLFFAAFHGRDAALGELLLELPEALGVLLGGRDALLQILGPEVRFRIACVDPLRLIGDTVALRHALGDFEAVAPVQLVFDANLVVEVARSLLVLATSFRVDRVPHDVDVWVIFIAVNEAGVVVTGRKFLGQIRANFKQRIVRNLLGVAVVRIEVVARVVVLAATFVIELLPRQIPRLGNLVFAF